MADMDYNPNPTFQVESAETNHVGEEEATKTNPEGLSVKIPNSRGSESPTVNTPMVSDLRCVHVAICLTLCYL